MDHNQFGPHRFYSRRRPELQRNQFPFENRPFGNQFEDIPFDNMGDREENEPLTNNAHNEDLEARDILRGLVTG